MLNLCLLFGYLLLQVSSASATPTLVRPPVEGSVTSYPLQDQPFTSSIQPIQAWNIMGTC
jgi:hypothetical protein